MPASKRLPEDRLLPGRSKRASHHVGTIPAAHDTSSGQGVHGSTARGKDTSTDYEQRQTWPRHRVVDKVEEALNRVSEPRQNYILKGEINQMGIWSGQLDSNQRPAVPKTAALPGCAIPRLSGKRPRYTLKALPARRLAAISMAIKQRMRDAVSGFDPIFLCGAGDHLQHPLRQPP
jgi:hypothetical protein